MPKKYIIYIEDDHFQRSLYSGVIQRIIDALNLGYKVISVENCEDVLNFIKGSTQTINIPRNELGVILCDILLPELSGLQFLKEIHNLNDPIPVIILTADEDEKIKNKALALGAFDYIIKSKNKEELDKLIDLILQKMK